RRCREHRRSRTRSPCRSSAPRPSPRRDWARSPPRSCWASACGGSAGGARGLGEGVGAEDPAPVDAAADDPLVRERATTAHAFDPAEIHRSERARTPPPILLAAMPLAVVIAVNLLMSFFVLPRMDTVFLAEPRWGATSLAAVGGVWSVAGALAGADLRVVGA